MHASIIRLELERSVPFVDCGRYGRSLAAALDAVEGFVAFIAFETEEGALAGMCLCLDRAALGAALQATAVWQGQHGGPAGASMQPLITGEVVAQRGF